MEKPPKNFNQLQQSCRNIRELLESIVKIESHSKFLQQILEKPEGDGLVRNWGVRDRMLTIEKNLIKKEISLNILFLKMEFLMRSLKPQNKIDQQYIVGIFLKEMESFKQKS